MGIMQQGSKGYHYGEKAELEKRSVWNWGSEIAISLFSEMPMFAVDFDDPFVTVGPDRLKESVVDIVQEMTEWETVGVVRYREEKGNVEVIIVTTVPDIFDQAYHKLQERVMQRLEELGAESFRKKLDRAIVEVEKA
ncbi:MAG: hypothetical protein Q9209_007132 [Squamulea sp. 1 TL-2023]